MAQHRLKTAAVRDFTVNDVAFMTEDDAFWHFVKIRWGDRDHAICPHCGVVDQHYFRQTRKQWRCKHCDGYFSVTTKSVFEDHKLGFKRMLLGLMEFISSANGISHHALSRKMNVQQKTAQAFVGKIREALWGSRPQIKLEGTVQIDGGHFGGRPRHGRVRKQSKAAIAAHVEAQIIGKKNQDKAPRRAGRSKKNWIRFKKRRVVMVLRELYPERGKGAKRTIVAVCMSENETDAIQLAQSYIAPGSLVMTDENPAYNQLSCWHDHRTVQHAVEFSTVDGVNDNQAESYFSRLRRYVLGVSHRIEPKYMADIGVEMAWREDVRSNTEGEKLSLLLKAAFSRGKSKWWRGYWQGFMREGELLWSSTQGSAA